jgi:hypothetical protein
MRKDEGGLVKPDPTIFSAFLGEWLKEHAKSNCTLKRSSVTTSSLPTCCPISVPPSYKTCPRSRWSASSTTSRTPAAGIGKRRRNGCSRPRQSAISPVSSMRRSIPSGAGRRSHTGHSPDFPLADIDRFANCNALLADLFVDDLADRFGDLERALIGREHILLPAELSTLPVCRPITGIEAQWARSSGT